MFERKTAVFGLVLIVLMLAGCRRDNTPIPPRSADVMTDSSKRSYLPVRVPDRKGESVLGQVAAADAVVAADKRETANGAVKIDDSTAEAAANSFVAMVLATDLQDLPKIMVADQAEAVGKMAEGLAPLAEAARQLKSAIDEKFPDNNIAGFAPAIAPGLADWVASQTKTEVKPGSSDDEFEATITSGPEGDNATPPVKLTVKKVDGAWRVMLPEFNPDDEAAKAEPKKIEAYKDLARRIRTGEFQDVEAVKTQVASAVAGTYEPAPSNKAVAKPPDKSAKAKNASPAPKPKRRERDAVDDTVGPGFLPRG